VPTTASGLPASTTEFLTQKARQLWGWLGAADIPDEDPPYGYDPGATAAARREEKKQLEQLRQQMQADLAAQLRLMEARERERERSMAQLRAELAHAPAVAPEAAQLQARLAAESREKSAQETAMQASVAAAAAQNQELDAKIQQLNQLIERLNTQAAALVPSAPVPVAPAPPELVKPALSPPVASRLVERPAAVPAATSSPAVLGSFLPALRAQWVAWQTMAKPHTARWWAWLQQGNRLRLAAGLAAGAVVVLWLLGHIGGPPPVPYQENGRWGYADDKGKTLILPQFTAAGPFEAGRAVVAKGGVYGVIDEDGKEVIAPAYDALNPFAGGYARARVGQVYTFLDEQGQEFDTYYFNALDFAEGRAAVLDYRGWHYISGPTEPEKPVIFIEAYSFVHGLARVKLATGYTYITPDYLDNPSRGTKPFGRYQLATDFADGKARVTRNGHSFYIDKNGEEVK
jgi:hypothetical protein